MSTYIKVPFTYDVIFHTGYLVTIYMTVNPVMLSGYKFSEYFYFEVIVS